MATKLAVNPATGKLDLISVEVPAGNNTEIQFNDSGAFGADSNLTWDGSTLSVTGNLDLGFTLGSVAFQGASGLTQDNANFFWDDSNNRFGIGTNSPQTPFQIGNGTMAGVPQTEIFNIRDNTASSYNNLAHFNNDQASSRSAFLVSNSATGWSDNFLMICTHGRSMGTGNYGGSANDSGKAMIIAQGSEITDLLIGHFNADPITFMTNNIFRVRIDSSGRMGINQLSPGSMLDIAINGTTVPGLEINGIAAQSSDYVDINTSAGGSVFNIKSDGDVGIGTASPNGKLELRGTFVTTATNGLDSVTSGAVFTGVGNNGFYSYRPTNGTNQYMAFQCTPKGTGASTLRTAFSLYHNDYVADFNAHGSPARDERLVLTSTDSKYSINVNASGTSPVAGALYPLHFQMGGSDRIVFPITGSIISIESGAVINIPTTTTTGLEINGIASQSSDYVDINDNSSNPVLNVASSKNVGIGVASPSGVLHVRGALNGNPPVKLCKTDNSFSNPFTSEAIISDDEIAVYHQAGIYGGLDLSGFTNNNTQAFFLQGYMGVTNPTEAAVLVRGFKLSGTSRTALTGTEKVMEIWTGSSVLHSFRADGSHHVDGDNYKTKWGAGQDMSVYYDGTNGNIKTDEVAASDLNITTGAAKTLELQTSTWDDLMVQLSSIRLGGAQPPADVSFKDGLVLNFTNTTDKTIYFNAQLPHTYKQGTDIKLHIHWTLPTAGSGAGAENVKWDLTYSWQNIDGGAFPASSSATVTVDVQNFSAETHEVDGIATITGTSKNISSMLICSLTRDTSVANNYADGAYLVGVDFHHEINTMGSRQEFVK